MSNDGLQALEPRIVWDLFRQITRIPRCSGKEEKIRSWVSGWAAAHGVSSAEDPAGNLVLRREASPGYESVPALVLQAHLDMVCDKIAGTSVDFAADGITAYVEAGWVRARGTTLGADNGIGVAYALAALADSTLRHGPLEALLTADEEGGMKGALGLKAASLSGRHLLNLDSEELGQVTIGTAGGEYTDYCLPARPSKASGWSALEILVDGFAGGHSGIQIHLPHHNAIKVVLAGLETLRARTALRIAAFEGGTASNVIPPSARCLLLVPAASLPVALETLERWRERTLAEARRHEPNAAIAVREPGASPASRSAYSEEDTARICRLLAEIPHGPLAYSRDIEGLVETSNNLACLKSGARGFEVFTNARGSVESALVELSRRLRALGEGRGAAVKQHTRYPGWTADPGSAFTLFVKRQYEEVLGAPVELKAFHAGLECGVFKGVLADLEMVSLGPTLQGVHSVEEALDIASVEVVWRVLRGIIANMGFLAERGT